MVGIGIYVKRSPGAVRLYCETFGPEAGYNVLNDDGTYFHSELCRDAEPFCAVSEARENTYTDRNPVELGVEFDKREEMEKAFSLLSDGGRVDMEICGLPRSRRSACVTDRFGVRWFLSMPQHRPPEDW